MLLVATPHVIESQCLEQARLERGKERTDRGAVGTLDRQLEQDAPEVHSLLPAKLGEPHRIQRAARPGRRAHGASENIHATGESGAQHGELELRVRRQDGERHAAPVHGGRVHELAIGPYHPALDHGAGSEREELRRGRPVQCAGVPRHE
jgi:hypothetical protein